MLEAVYVECREEKRIAAIKTKPAFKPLFQIGITREDSDVAIVHENTKERGKRHQRLMTLRTILHVSAGDGNASEHTLNMELRYCWGRDKQEEAL